MGTPSGERLLSHLKLGRLRAFVSSASPKIKIKNIFKITLRKSHNVSTSATKIYLLRMKII
jgi:hypothetical protein